LIPLSDPSNVSVVDSRSLLESEFIRHQTAAEQFPPIIPLSVIRSRIWSFRQTLEQHSSRDVCASCGIFDNSAKMRSITEDDTCLNKIKDAGLDACGYHNRSWSFCSDCYTNIVGDRIPKFSAGNLINVVMCDKYPAVLKDLTFIEECVIARRHPIGSILKLRPGNRRSPSNYYALRGHMVVVPQNPGPLLNILPSSDLRLQDIVKVVWVGKCHPSTDDLKPFLQVRKAKILDALQWLILHHQHYHDPSINYSLLSSWADTFIPPQISVNMTCLDSSDSNECEGYVANLESDNFENDLQAALNDDAVDPETVLASGSLYTDLNDERANCDLQVLRALTTVVESNLSNIDNHDSSLIDIDYSEPGSVDQNLAESFNPLQSSKSPNQSNYIRYGFSNNSTALSSIWTDPQYFTTAFPTLFPTGAGGHLDDRPTKVSLQAFAKWCLLHHSRR
jgi:hypothetical protein